MAYWLMKSEPSEFSIDDLRALGKKSQPWDGVRNYQARNMLRDGFRRGDRALFYHSSCDQPGIAGVMEVTSDPYPDPTQFDPADPHYDSKSRREDPRWFLVDVRFERALRRPLPLTELKTHRALQQMPLLRRGNRLSVMPVTKPEWDYILRLERKSRVKG